MAQSITCPQCGTTLPPDAPAGICPKCLMQAALANSAVGGQPADAGTFSGLEAVSAPDPLVASRIFRFLLALHVGIVALNVIFTWGYTAGAAWYFDGAFNGVYNFFMIVLGSNWIIFMAYWWYLHAKQPGVPRSLADAWRITQRPDRRLLRVWPLWVGYVVFGMLMGPAVLVVPDAVAAWLMTLWLFLLGPAIFVACIRWAYGPLRTA